MGRKNTRQFTKIYCRKTCTRKIKKYMKELIKTVLAITIIFTVAKILSDSFLSGWISSVVCYVFLDITSDKK